MKATVIYGPPGTGKSTEIMRRVQAAKDAGAPDAKIGLVSFTRAAAQELARRAGVKAGRNISTIHSYAFRLAGISRDQVIDRADLADFSRVSKIETTGAGVYDEESLGPGDQYLTMYGFQRSRMIESTKRGFYEGGREGSLVEYQHFVKVYEQYKAAHGLVDFADMLDRAMLTDPRELGLDILFLDEAQDFSVAQWELVHHWMPHVREVVVAMDDDQTLYKWNGADPDGGVKFERRYGAERVVLQQSYRIPARVHRLAQWLIENVQDRVSKQYLPRDEEGVVQRFSTLAMVPKPDPAQETLVLFRNHSMRTEIEDWLQDMSVPYITDNGKPGPLQGYYARCIQAWDRAKSAYKATGNPMVEPRDWVVMTRCAMSVHRRAFQNERIEELLGHDWWNVFAIPADLGVYLRRIYREYGKIRPDTRVHLSTIHGSKGREADRVILLDGMSQRTAEGYSHDPDTEIRTFYVGITRTRQRLDIVTADNPMGLLHQGERA